MSIKQIAAFSAKARSDAALAEQLKACEKMKELLALAKSNGFEFIEDTLYPPNEPQFTEDQLSARVGRNSAAYCAEWFYAAVIQQVTLR